MRPADRDRMRVPDTALHCQVTETQLSIRDMTEIHISFLLAIAITIAPAIVAAIVTAIVTAIVAAIAVPLVAVAVSGNSTAAEGESNPVATVQRGVCCLGTAHPIRAFWFTFTQQVVYGETGSWTW